MDGLLGKYMQGVPPTEKESVCIFGFLVSSLVLLPVLLCDRICTAHTGNALPAEHKNNQ